MSIACAVFCARAPRRTVWRWGLALWIAGSAVLQANAAETRDFPLMRALQRPAAEAGELGCFVLDEALFEATDNAYANLRVFDGGDGETPFLVRNRRRTRKRVREREWPIKVVSLEETDDNSIGVVLEVEGPRRPQRPVALDVVTQVRNFEKEVRVSGSEDGESWELLTDAAPIFDYTRFMDVSRKRVELPPRVFRFYRLEIGHIAEERRLPLTRIVREMRGDTLVSEVEKAEFAREDLRIDRFRLLAAETEMVHADKVHSPYTATAFGVAEDTERKASVVTFGTARVPVVAVTLQLGSRNFHRSVRVDGRNDAEGPWQALVATTLTGIELGGASPESRTVRFPRPTRMREYRLTILNQDNPPLDVRGVDVEGEVMEAVFFCRADAEYRAMYGAESMRSPAYDIAAVLSKGQSVERLIAYGLGEEQANPVFRPPGRLPRWGGRGLLVAAVVAMVITLMVLIAGALKRMDRFGDRRF